MGKVKSVFKRRANLLFFVIISALFLVALPGMQSIKGATSLRNEVPMYMVDESMTSRFNYSCVLASSDKIHCLAGRLNPWTFTESNHAYDPVTGGWESKADYPLHQDLPILVSHGDYIYAFDYWGDDEYHVYSVINDNWANGSLSPLIGDNEFWPIGATSYNNNVYLLGELIENGGGGSGARYLNLYSYNTSASEWSVAYSSEISATDARREAKTASIDNEIYIFGGYDATGVYKRTTLVYDITNGSVTSKADMPTFRGGSPTTVGSDGKIYLFGGALNPAEFQDGISTMSVISYDPLTNSWSDEAPMSSDGAGGAVLGSDGEIYIFVPNDGEGGIFGPPIEERPILDFYIDQSYSVSWDIDESTNTYKAYAPSLVTAHCPPNFRRCNYHVTPGTENKSLQLNPVLSDGRLVATPDEFSMANMAFLAPVGETLERIAVRFAPNVSISGSTDWDGVFHFPSFLSEPSVSPTGDGVEVDKVVKLGGNVSLSLSAPARLVIPGGGEDGYRVGYVEPGSDEFVEITTTCNEDTLEATTEQLGAGEACKMVVEEPDDIAPEYLEPKRLVVWTTHFTEFVTYEAADEGGDDDRVLPRTGFSKVTLSNIIGFFSKIFNQE